ncbi:hypothetical protein N005_12510 [Pseudomonas mediterranea CFBP 5447]|nr:hypothetical protein N005_12510 [Pseudomonas mediterranea CFBP 5447]
MAPGLSPVTTPLLAMVAVFNIVASRPTAIASRLAPTRDCGVRWFCIGHRACGSAPARDSGGPANIDVTDR